jgi:polar amino acid transport system substrate-binding protein
VLVLSTFVSCDLPRDADNTLDRVRAEHVARVGVAEAPPWVVNASAANPSGVEPALVIDMLRQMGAAPRWVRGGEGELLRALEEREVDLVIGGLTESMPWRKEVAFTRPFYTDSIHEQKHVMAVAPGENAWLVYVERFLMDRESTVALLLRADRP